MEAADELDGIKFLLSNFEEMALEIFSECYDSDKETMLENVRSAFAGMKAQVEPFSTAAELEALKASF